MYHARMHLQTPPIIQKNTRKHQPMVERFGSNVMEAVAGCNENAAAWVLHMEQSHKESAVGMKEEDTMHSTDKLMVSCLR